ncbi:MAG: 30S ribosomal protein S16 [Rickettsiales bacterium]|nr:30S ribosomal protein S16 [Rickettsiales bacterium]|tara:strand:+ start:7333 stop:7767 length:435 start_codon:yes stop_codon:yes gene_type:complete
MAVKIRLARGGSKKKPFYRIVAADVRAPRDGKFLEKLGTFNPLIEENRINLNQERVQYWLSTGAEATDRVHKILAELKILEPKKRTEQTKQHLPKKKAQERMAEKAAAEAEAKAAAEEAKKAAEAEAEAPTADEFSTEDKPAAE